MTSMGKCPGNCRVSMDVIFCLEGESCLEGFPFENVTSR